MGPFSGGALWFQKIVRNVSDESAASIFSAEACLLLYTQNGVSKQL
jgi:hypothetical protein